MSKEKLYAVKNDDGKYWDFNDLDGFWKLIGVSRPITVSEENAKNTVKHYGGHVVTLVEEPEKVVLTKEQAETVEEAHDSNYPASYFSGSVDNEELLMEAYVNGYTVAKETKYNVKVPHTKDVWYYKSWNNHLSTIGPGADKKLRDEFTELEIEHYGLQDCEKVWCDSDGE